MHKSASKRTGAVGLNLLEITRYTILRINIFESTNLVSMIDLSYSFQVFVNGKPITATHSFELIVGDKLSFVKNLFTYLLVLINTKIKEELLIK